MQQQTERTLSYNIITQTIRTNQGIVLDERCNGVTAVNIGTTNGNVHGVPLAPPSAGSLLGESFAFGGNRNEVFEGRIDVSFPGGNDNGNRILIMQKIYLPDTKKLMQL